MRQGVFPSWLTQYQTDRQSWQAYRELRANLVVTWSNRYLVDLPVDTAVVSSPQPGGTAPDPGNRLGLGCF